MKIFLPALILFLFIAGCGKKDTVCNFTEVSITAPGIEVQQLKDSLTAYGITATPHTSGFFYKINSAGSGTSVSNLCTAVTVTYKGQFFNGNIFDSTKANQTASFQLGEVIQGWIKGLPLVSKGGDIDLYIPPSLAYGPYPVPRTGAVIIPANSYLVFNIHVVDIQ